MKLSRLDHQFIEFMVPSAEHRRIIKDSLAYKSDVFLQSPGNWFVNYGRNWGMFFYFLAELLVAFFKRPPAKTPELIGFDTNYQTTKDREDYFRYNLPDQPFKIINFYARIPYIPNKREALRQIVWLPYFLLCSLAARTQLSREYVRTVRASLLVYSHVSLSLETAVYLFHLHRHETPFIAAHLQNHNIYVNLVAWDPPLAAHNKYLIGDTLKLCSPYQLDEVKQFQPLGNFHHTDLWPLEKIHRLLAYYKDQDIPHFPNLIGLYTQGYWMRTQVGKSGQQGEQWDRQERELVAAMCHYIECHPETHLIVYPHPMERRHVETTGEYPFRDFQNHPRIEIDFSGDNSMNTFHKVGLGVTIMSSVGFERVYLGFRTLFYVPYVSHADLSIESPYNPLYIRSKEELWAQMDVLRPMTHNQFMDSYFGGFFLDWKPQSVSLEML